MRIRSRQFASLLLAATIALPAAIAGCAARASYSYYDRDHNDYHTWNHDEVVFYSQWETDTHRNHRDFRKRSDVEQKEYWQWRHDHDHDHDHH